MGRSYFFECVRCGYRARVSGKSDRGVNFHVQTVFCRDCKELYDVVTRLRALDERRNTFHQALQRARLLNPYRAPKVPPKFDLVLNRLPYSGSMHFKWVQYPLQCPVSQVHRVQAWNEPDKCPRCGIYLDKNALPYRIWD